MCAAAAFHFTAQMKHWQVQGCVLHGLCIAFIVATDCMPDLLGAALPVGTLFVTRLVLPVSPVADLPHNVERSAKLYALRQNLIGVVVGAGKQCRCPKAAPGITGCHHHTELCQGVPAAMLMLNDLIIVFDA